MNIRKEIQQALAAQDFDRVVQCFEANDAQTTRYLQMHVYGRPDDPVRWTAIDHLGRLAGRYAEDNDALFRNIIRRFIWQMCEESANVPWASAEVVGSIIANVPSASRNLSARSFTTPISTTSATQDSTGCCRSSCVTTPKR